MQQHRGSYQQLMGGSAEPRQPHTGGPLGELSQAKNQRQNELRNMNPNTTSGMKAQSSSKKLKDLPANPTQVTPIRPVHNESGQSP